MSAHDDLVRDLIAERYNGAWWPISPPAPITYPDTPAGIAERRARLLELE